MSINGTQHIALVTGASSGIGKAIAEQLLRDGLVVNPGPARGTPAAPMV